MFNRLKGFLLFLIVSASLNCFAQAPLPYTTFTGPINYVRTWSVTAPVVNANDLNLNTQLPVALMSTQYLDGIGRPIQTVIKKGSLITPTDNPTSSTNAVDFVSTQVYDQYGRIVQNYLPFAANVTNNTHINDGLFKQNPFEQQQFFYSDNNNNSPIKNQGETFYYGQTNFEPSPLNRISGTYAAGNSWVDLGKGIKVKYCLNTDIDNVRFWQVQESTIQGDFATYYSSPYLANTLYKTIIQDENEKQVIEFRDKSGRVVLKKVQFTGNSDDGTGIGYSNWICTYYIYDKLGQLRCVIQPNAVKEIESSWTLNTTQLNELCFRYEYDYKGRAVVKKVPGAAPEYMVYDSRNRLVMFQDGNLAVGSTKKWLVTLYDDLNRPIETGMWNETQTSDNISNWSYHSGQANNPSILNYPFNPNSPPVSGWETLTVTHYDNYDGTPSGLSNSLETSYYSNDFSTSYNVSPDYAQPLIQSNATTGMVTWTKRKVLGTTSQFISSVNIYDEGGRIIQLKTINHTGGQDISSTQYSFSGQVLYSHLRHQIQSAPVQTYTAANRNTFDELGRMVMTEKKIENGTWKKVSKFRYDALSQLKFKELLPGNPELFVLDPYGNPISQPALETLTYDYNIRGWILGMNREFIKTNNGSKFGFELSYDKRKSILDDFTANQYDKEQYNGNVAGAMWKSFGDKEIRKFDFDYDPANRLWKADFMQRTGSDWSNSIVKFSVQMGDGSNFSSAYDLNGNILKMQQFGLKLDGSTLIDNLTYNYSTSSNKLSSVTDPAAVQNLGDFTDKNISGADYGYDLNGNLITDKNKRINGNTGIDQTSGGAITYNYLNLPETISIQNDNTSSKGTIVYTYDASGNKLSKTVTENLTGALSGTTKTTITKYIEDFVYQSLTFSASNPPEPNYSDQLQFFGHSEGRIRPVRTSGSISGFVYDFMIKDHVGNIRMVLTEEERTKAYQATIETANRNNEVALFNNIPATESTKPSGFDSDNNNQKVTKLFSSTSSEKRLGPGIVLKVMAGDKFKARTFGWYQPGNTDVNEESGVASIVNTLLSSFSNNYTTAGGSHGITGSQLSSGTTLNAPLGSALSSRNYDPSIPKAYLNWIVLDEEQFKLVDGNYGAVQIPAITGTTDKRLIQSAGGDEITVNKNGYLYVYVTNESKGSVYFDDIRVDHISGPLLEETHYYPFGLPMAGISSRAFLDVVNKYKFNGNEYQNQEFTDGSGLETMDFNARMYDPQLGRFCSIDPLSEYMRSWSAYAFAFDNPIRFVDPCGMNPEDSVTKKDVEPSENGGKVKPLDEVVVVSSKKSSGWLSDFVHGALDVVGVLDPIGIADGLNAVIYLAEGDLKNAAFSAISIIPFADGVKSLKYADEAAEVINDVVKYEDEVQEIVVKNLDESVTNTKMGGKLTEPNLPDKTIVKEDGVEIVHYTRSGDHGPAHMHVKGGGQETRIGQNGKPIKGSKPLTSKQQQVVNNNKSTIRKAGKQMMKWHKYNKI